MSYLFFLGPLLMAIVAVLIIAAALRRVVPTNMVHIVQSSKGRHLQKVGLLVVTMPTVL
jgi:hypothetical protein